MIYTVAAADAKRLNLSPSTLEEEVLRNVAVILATPVGSVPLNRDLGIDTSYIDRPATVVRPILIGAIKKAIQTYEPRADVVSISVDEDPDAPGRFISTVEVNITNE